jgi:hypothetical protein
MGFNDLDEFFDDTLPLPIAGRVYVVPSPDAEVGLWCTRLFSAAQIKAAGGEADMPTELDDDAELGMYSRVLGTAYAEMLADNVPISRITFAGQTAFIWITQGKVTAEVFWNNSGNLQAPNRETRRSTRTGAASATPGRGSMSGTKSQPRKRTASPAKATPSRGKTSTSTGR